jgi:hypothetical protein
MMRIGLLSVLALGLASATAQTPPPQPTIDLAASGAATTTGNGSATASGSVTIPAGWQLSIHVVTVRYQKQTGGKSLNAFIPVKGGKFSANVELKSGSYKAWAVIDVKDTEGREKQISSEPQMFNIP